MPEPSKLVAALVKAQAAYPVIPKNKTAKVKMKSGGEFSYKYADWADVLRVILPVLSQNELAFSQPMKRTDLKLCLTSRLMHVSGEILESDGISIPETLDPQSFGSILTYWRRYDGCALLGIAPDEDTDALGKEKKTKQDKQIEQQEKTSKPLTATGARQFWSAANTGGKKPNEIKAYLANLKYSSIEELTQGELEMAIKWALGNKAEIHEMVQSKCFKHGVHGGEVCPKCQADESA